MSKTREQDLREFGITSPEIEDLKEEYKLQVKRGNLVYAAQIKRDIERLSNQFEAVRHQKATAEIVTQMRSRWRY